MFMFSVSVGIIVVVMFASFFVLFLWVFVSVFFVFSGMLFRRVIVTHLGVWFEEEKWTVNAEFMIIPAGLIGL